MYVCIHLCMYIYIYIDISTHVYMEVCKLRCTYVQEKANPKQQKWKKNTTKYRLIFRTKIDWFFGKKSIVFFLDWFFQKSREIYWFFSIFLFRLKKINLDWFFSILEPLGRDGPRSGDHHGWLNMVPFKRDVCYKIYVQLNSFLLRHSISSHDGSTLWIF